MEIGSAITFLHFPEIIDNERGHLTFIEGGGTHIPFEIKRVFYVYGVPDTKVVRGRHAHKTCEQILIALSGNVLIEAYQTRYSLCRPNIGLYIPAGVLIEMRDFSQDCVLLVLASEHFDEEDYVKYTNPL